jgi:hypothetical protein
MKDHGGALAHTVDATTDHVAAEDSQLKVTRSQPKVALESLQRQWLVQHLPLLLEWKVVAHKISWVSEQKMRVEVTAELTGFPIDVAGCPREVNQVPAGLGSKPDGVPFVIGRHGVNDVTRNVVRRFHDARNLHRFNSRISAEWMKKNIS